MDLSLVLICIYYFTIVDTLNKHITKIQMSKLLFVFRDQWVWAIFFSETARLTDKILRTIWKLIFIIITTFEERILFAHRNIAKWLYTSELYHLNYVIFIGFHIQLQYFFESIIGIKKNWISFSHRVAQFNEIVHSINTLTWVMAFLIRDKVVTLCNFYTT